MYPHPDAGPFEQAVFWLLRQKKTPLGRCFTLCSFGSWCAILYYMLKMAGVFGVDAEPEATLNISGSAAPTTRLRQPGAPP